MTELGLVRNLSQALASAVDGVMLVGTGGAQPLGITNSIGINTESGTSITRAALLDMQKLASDANAIVNPSAAGYAAAPTTAALLAGRVEFASGSSTQWQGGLARGTVCGCPAMTTKSLGTGNLIFGDFSQLLLVEFGPLQIAVNRSDTRFNQGLVAIRALWMVDVLVLEPKWFTFAQTVT